VWCSPEAPAALVGGGPAAMVARHGREALAARAAGRPQPRDLERAAGHRAWQGQQLSATTRRRPHAVARPVAEQCATEAARALLLRGLAIVRSEATGKRIRTIERRTSE
jgi:hypothetical protein